MRSMRYSPKIFSRSILCELLNAPQDGRTPLHWAATSNSVDIARYLIDQGADVNRGDSGGWTPLHIAGMPATSDFVPVIDSCAFALTSVSWLASGGFEDVVTELLGSGADVNQGNAKGLTDLSASIPRATWPVLTP